MERCPRALDLIEVLRMRRVLRSLRRLFWPMVFVVLAGVGVAYVTGNIPYRVYVVHTGSMQPNLPPTSAAIVHVQSDHGQYRVGEVISFNSPNGVVTHRIVSVNNAAGTVRTKGDANKTADAWPVPDDRIIGPVVAAPRTVGWFIIWLFKTTGGLSVIALILFLVLAFSHAKSFKEDVQNQPVASQ